MFVPEVTISGTESSSGSAVAKKATTDSPTKVSSAQVLACITSPVWSSWRARRRRTSHATTPATSTNASQRMIRSRASTEGSANPRFEMKTISQSVTCSAICGRERKTASHQKTICTSSGVLRTVST